MVQEEISLNIQLRSTGRKGEVRRMRKGGKLPAILYGGKEKPLPVFVEEKELLKLLHTVHSENVIISLRISDSGEKQGAKPIPAIIKEIQVDPVSRKLLHVDLYRVSMKQEVKVNVPIEIYGEAEGVRKGGVLDQVIHEVQVKCLPSKIPEKIICDVSSLEMGDILTIRDLDVPKGVEILDDPGKIVVSIIAPAGVEEKPATEAVGEEVKEPEVIGKGKKKEEEEEEAQE